MRGMQRYGQLSWVWALANHHWAERHVDHQEKIVMPKSGGLISDPNTLRGVNSVFAFDAGSVESVGSRRACRAVRGTWNCTKSASVTKPKIESGLTPFPWTVNGLRYQQSL